MTTARTSLSAWEIGTVVGLAASAVGIYWIMVAEIGFLLPPFIFGSIALVLALLANAEKFLAQTSTLVQRAAPEVRGDVVAFERAAAGVKTATAMSPPPPDVLKHTVAAPPHAGPARPGLQPPTSQRDLRGAQQF